MYRILPVCFEMIDFMETEVNEDELEDEDSKNIPLGVEIEENQAKKKTSLT